MPVLTEGDVNARVWIRIREVEQSLALIEQILDASARRPDPLPRSTGGIGEGLALGRELSAAMFWSGCGSTPTAGSRAATCAIRPGFSGRCWKPRSRAISSPTSRSAINRSTAPIQGTISRCDRTMLRSLLEASAPADRAPPPVGRCGARRAGARSSTAPRAGGSAAASSIREVDAGSCNGCELEIHALNNAFYDLERFGLRFVASPRHADVLMVTGPVTQEHARGAGAHLSRDAGSQMGGRGRRLRRSTAACSPGATPSPAASSQVVPVDLHIPGCPPSPTELLKGLIALIDHASGQARRP